jgi:hypothetical protein
MPWETCADVSVSPSFLFVMLTALRFSRISHSVRLTPIVAARSQRAYHAFHEDQANVLPNLIEPQSAAFKVHTDRSLLPLHL